MSRSLEPLAKRRRTTTTAMSTKGQVVIPRAIRHGLGWKPGTVLEVEQRGGVIALRPARKAPRTSVDDLVGCLPWAGPPRTLEDMDAGIARGEKKSLTVLDTADALRLASSGEGDGFATFDRRLAARANAIERTPPVRQIGRGWRSSA